MLRHGKTINDFKTEVKRQFKSKLIELRNKEQDSRRNVREYNLTESPKSRRDNVRGLYAHFINDYNGIMTVDLAEQILKDIEHEMLLEREECEVKMYEEYCEKEMAALLENLSNPCSVCNKIVEDVSDVVICKDCKKAF